MDDVLDIFADVPSSEIAKSGFSGGEIGLVDLLVSAGLAQSRGEARRLTQGGGVYLNNVRVADVQRAVSLNDSIEGKVFILRKGQKEYRLVKITG
jgi:tyrosyl-tRNA synthetase